ncbi:MAG: DegT/DnrJ/EryC1/StrS aminotransferase family protein [Gallionella sp.]|nr:DegT/DnrJ/EryC1/StrS aminotransferase family protein [Gallionella sp.]
MIRLSKSCISAAEKQAVMAVLDKEFLGMGLEVQRFENALETFFGRAAVCVNTGTAALHLALQACEIGHGDEVLIPSLTYVASFQAVAATGANPVACDINPSTLTLDWRDAEKRLSPKTKAVMPVHYSGGAGDLSGIYAFAERCGLRVIEDAAHAFGSNYKGARVGANGDIVCFSFDGIKNITSGEGGCIVTGDQNILRKVRDARLLGVEKDSERRYAGERSWEFDVTAQGWRYHMSDIMAAIGLVQLGRLEEFTDKRRLLARRYDEQLASFPRLSRLPHNYSEVVPHIYPVLLPDGADRKTIRSRMLDAGVQTGVHYQPNHVLTFFRDSDALPLPVVDNIAPRLLSLPLHPDLSLADVDSCVNHLIGALNG